MDSDVKNRRNLAERGGRRLAWATVALVSVGALLLLGPNQVVRTQSGTTGTPGAASVVAKIRELNTANEEIRQVAFGPNGAAVILHGTNAATWIQVPQTLADKLNELIGAGNQVRHVAFAPGSGWVVLHSANEAVWNGIPQRAADKIRELYGAGRQMKVVAFTSSGEWSILYGSQCGAGPCGGSHSSGIPETAFKKLVELTDGNIAIKSMAYAPGSGWVILHGANDATWNSIPQAAVDKIRQLYQAGSQMKQIAFHDRRGLDRPLRTQRCVLGRAPLRASLPTPEA